MAEIGWPDILILAVILFSILIGLFRGFIKESISLVTWISAVVLAVVFSGPFSSILTFTKEPFIKTIAAFFIIFILTVLVGSIINFFVGKLVRSTPFSSPDRVLGGAFGLFRGVVIVTIVVLLAGLTPLTKADTWTSSYSIEKFEVLALWVKDRLPEEHAKPFKFPERKSEVKSQKS